MRFLTLAASLLSISSIVCGASNETVDSRVLLPKDFSPPQVFKHVNLVRNTNLEKGYVRETINVVVENQDKEPQSTYYIPFPSDVFGRVGGLQVRDKKDSKKTSFPVTSTELVERSEPVILSIGRNSRRAVTPNTSELTSPSRSPRRPKSHSAFPIISSVR